MSVELQDQRKIYTGNGVTDTFAFPFTLEDGSQVKVVVADEHGAETTLTYGDDYTVTFDVQPEGIVQSTGSVVLNSPLTSGYKIALMSNIPEDQQRTFPDNSPYYQEQVEGGIDKNTRLIQQLRDEVERSVRMQDTSEQTPAQFIADIYQAKSDAAASATAAAGSASDASGYANAASGYANDASGYASAAEGYKNQAQDIIDTAITATGTTTGRSLASRFSDVINVLDFGANGNGTTVTNTPILNAIQASVDATGTITDVDGNAMLRTPIFFPRGTYKISSSSIMTYFQSFVGNGAKLLYNSKEYWIGEAVRGTLYVGNDDKMESETIPGTYKPVVPLDGLVNIANGQLRFWPDLNGDGDYDADVYATGNLYLVGESSVQLLHRGNGRARVAVQDQANWVTVESNTDFPDEDRPAYTQKKGIVYLQPGVQNNNSPVYWYDDSDPDNIKVPTNYTDLAITRYRDSALCAYFDMKSLRVGVGTSSPICALDVYGTSQMQNRARIGSSGASAAYLIFDSTVEGQHQTRPKIGAEGDEVQILSKARVVLRLTGDVSGGANGEVIPGYSGKYYLGNSSRKWDTVYAVNGSIDTSDERQKDNIADPDEALMRAWGKVNFKVFQFKDAIEKKGENARIHCGVIAQQVMEAFASEGLDASRYGLFCHDSWEAKPAKVDPDTGEVTDEAIEAGDSYGIRYSEALALECAYQRWRMDRLEAMISA